MTGFAHVKPGDTVTRLLAGTVSMQLRVAHVDDKLIYAGHEYEEGQEYPGWTFDRISGAEIDHGLGWGPMYGITGSYLVEIEI